MQRPASNSFNATRTSMLTDYRRFEEEEDAADLARVPFAAPATAPAAAGLEGLVVLAAALAPCGLATAAAAPTRAEPPPAAAAAPVVAFAAPLATGGRGPPGCDAARRAAAAAAAACCSASLCCACACSWGCSSCSDTTRGPGTNARGTLVPLLLASPSTAYVSSSP